MPTPLNIVNDSKMRFAWLAGRVPPRPLTGTFFVKATWKLNLGAAAELLPEDEQLNVDGEKTEGDDPAAPPVYPGDFALFKPSADVLLVGHAHTPQAKPLTQMLVTLRVGKWSKSLAVFGDRVWAVGLLSSRLGNPMPFTNMSLNWDRALGGPSFKANPHGRGVDPTQVAGVGMVPFAPNVESPARLVTSHSSRPEPASFAPLGSAWPQRARNLGTYNSKWQRERWPWLPDDFEWSYFNAASQDQRIEGFLRGDESIVLEGMHPEHPRFETQLPGLRPRWFLRQKHKDKLEFEEVPLRLDTLWIDADNLRAVTVWRGIIGIESLKMREITEHLLVTEALKTPDPGLAHFEAMLERRKAEIAKEGTEEEKDEPEAPPPPVESPDTSWVGALENEIAKMEVEAKSQMARLQSIWAQNKLAAAELFSLQPAAGTAPIDFKTIEKAIGEAQKAASAGSPSHAALFKEPWITPQLKQDLQDTEDFEKKFNAGKQPEPKAQDESDWSREKAQAHHAAKGSFDREDLAGLDLSGLDLSGAGFAGCDLSGANLSKANLSRCNFSGASLNKALLNEANLSGANLSEADASECNLTLAILKGASLDGAALTKAKLGGASLAAVTAKGADFSGADLTGADMAQSRLEQCDLSNAVLGKLRAAGVEWKECDICSAQAPAADFSGAVLHNLRATEAQLAGAKFAQARCTEAVLAEANLEGADLAHAQFPEAVLDGANLKGANCSAALLRQSRLCDTNLTGAKFVNADLFQASLENATADQADFSGANLYEAEFYQSSIQGARFEQANLKGSKLE